MATYTDVQNLDVTQLQVGDIINYNTLNNVQLNLTGFKFSCRLKGKCSTVYPGTIDDNYSAGANCYAEFDFSSVSDGNVTIGSSYGSYIAVTNGTGTDVRYNRIMVAGDSGNGDTSYQGGRGGSAGLFGGSGHNGASYSGADEGRGGTQNSGGTGYNAGSFGYGGASQSGSSANQQGYGGNGWYGGGGGKGSNYRNGGGGGGSSYLLTSDSYKPTGYLPEWTTYAPLISNTSSARLSATRDYYVIITILEVPSGVRTFKYYNGTNWVECYANYYDGTQFKRCTIHRYDGTDWD